tara:strand:+ start:49 stop:492 length:444 start_codon:yes stop_codon:yes gene_type:complete
MKYIKVLTRIKDPYEVLNQTSAQGKFLYKRFQKIDRKYQELIKYGKKAVGKDRIVIYTYDTDKMSFSADLSNEMIYRFPDKIIFVGRKKEGFVKGSIRSGTKFNINPVLKSALVGVEGYGGGHDQACGFCVKEEDFNRFIANFKREC